MVWPGKYESKDSKPIDFVTGMHAYALVVDNVNNQNGNGGVKKYKKI